MSHYYKPWLDGRDEKPPPPAHPLDKIRCRNGHSRYVVACMHNCPVERYCPEFWSFFGRRGVPPNEFYNAGGIGDEAMRRIVIDCDRCGRKDIPEVCSLYRLEGEGPEFRRPEEEHRAMVEACGYAWEDVGALVLHTLEQLERDRGWIHLCDRCFAQTTEWLAKICQVKQVPALRSAAAARRKEQAAGQKAGPKAGPKPAPKAAPPAAPPQAALPLAVDPDARAADRSLRVADAAHRGKPKPAPAPSRVAAAG